MESRYDHLLHEDRVYQKWELSGAFSPDHVRSLDNSEDTKATKNVSKAKKRTFTIIMPPPNANDPLHVGHAMFATVEDVLVRFHRMLGEETLWLPGTDHAGIETQFVYEKKLKNQGKSRFDFDRQTLFKQIWEYVQENSGVAVTQLKKLGASADWSRFRFTLEPSVVDVVIKTFLSLKEKGLIYRDLKLVNYCTKCGTGFSELEVLRAEKNTPFYYMKYGPFTIGTVRPETKFRDTALAVNPKDPRYAEYIGKTMKIPGLLGPLTMTVIPDDEVDPEFGTGIMKVTPAHDHHDYELGKKHNLAITPIIDFNGRMDFSWFIDAGGHPDATLEENAIYLERARSYHGKKVAAARELIVADLEKAGLLVKTDSNYKHAAAVCYRCGTTIEPLPLPQFFIKVEPLVKPILEALEKQELTVYGAGHDKILKHWLSNLKDWNISRQIVWGIQLPIWYDAATKGLRATFITSSGEKKGGEVSDLLKEHTLEELRAGMQQLQAPVGAEYVVSPTPPEGDYLQETDTFDTWFSSGQWPFATLQSLDADNKTRDFERFYPTSVMETGYDILPFWVMRMLMLGKFKTGKLPFKSIYLHGLVRDQKGQKMSKSKGNVINPLTVVESYGADALRLALIIRSSAGLDKSVGEADIRAMRNFTNKIWNAARFVLTNYTTDTSDQTNSTAPLDDAVLQKLHEITRDITQQLQDFKLGLAAETLFNEFWHWFCDEVIEATKKQQVSVSVLHQCLEVFLKLLHPFTPFVTEAVWEQMQQVRKSKNTANNLLIAAAWPLSQNELHEVA